MGLLDCGQEEGQGFAMQRFSSLRVFFLRAALGVLFALLLTRLFMPGADPGFVAVIAVLLVFSAYLLETLRKR